MVSRASEDELFALRYVRALTETEQRNIAAYVYRKLGPCRCDPPGSGEEHCTGHCEARQAGAAWRAQQPSEQGAIIAIVKKLRDEAAWWDASPAIHGNVIAHQLQKVADWAERGDWLPAGEGKDG